MRSVDGRLAGACYGYSIESCLPLRYLRTGDGAIPLRIVEQEHVVGELREQPVAEWPRRPGHELHAKIYLAGTEYRMWTDLEGWFTIDPTRPSITVPPCPDSVRIEERLWGIPLSLCYLPRGDFGVHAAAVEVAGSGILLAAPGRFGKTTLAAAFLAAGHRVLSEDLSCCRLAPGPFVLPGPAMLRVRRDVYERMVFPGTYAVAEEPHRVHLALEEHLRGNGHPVPLRAIAFLRERDAACWVERLSPVQALQDLWSLAFKLPTDEDRARRFGDLVSLADQVAVWNVHRPLTLSALPNVIDAIIGTCLP